MPPSLESSEWQSNEFRTLPPPFAWTWVSEFECESAELTASAVALDAGGNHKCYVPQQLAGHEAHDPTQHESGRCELQDCRDQPLSHDDRCISKSARNGIALTNWRLPRLHSTHSYQLLYSGAPLPAPSGRCCAGSICSRLCSWGPRPSPSTTRHLDRTR